MSEWVGVVLAGSLAAWLFDTVWSLVARRRGLNYGSLYYVSWLLYAAAGFFAEPHGGLAWAALAGGLVGLADSTLGWAISWRIGPGRLPVEVDDFTVLYVVCHVSAAAAGFAALGGGARHLARYLL